jgi:hypothetical protein
MHLANLCVPEHLVSVEDRLVVTLLGPDGLRTHDLDGQEVRLAGIPATIRDGRAAFRAGQFPRGKVELTLSVGPLNWAPAEEQKT